jgi:hypothetical protein
MQRFHSRGFWLLVMFYREDVCNYSCFPSFWNTIAAALRVFRCSDLIELPETFSCMTDEWFFLQAGKLIANLIVLGSGVLLRAVSQAYRQAIVSESLSLCLSLYPSLSPLYFSLYFLPNSIQRFCLQICGGLWNHPGDKFVQICPHFGFVFGYTLIDYICHILCFRDRSWTDCNSRVRALQTSWIN